MTENKCKICSKEMDAFMLKKCPMCHSMYCEDCEHKHGGLAFCTRNCAYMFYFPDEDDIDAE